MSSNIWFKIRTTIQNIMQMIVGTIHQISLLFFGWCQETSGNKIYVSLVEWVIAITLTSQVAAVIQTQFHNLVIHYGDVIMGAIASQITSLMSVYLTVYSDADQRKHQSSASLAGEFPAQMASNAENVSIRWRHHVMYYDTSGKSHCSAAPS